ncbi:MAG TPA: acetamidase/formamidase family protein [Virgibacillus sp.]|nr:acetamidase/formamidase family protein [Virgibacillus sp.]
MGKHVVKKYVYNFSANNEPALSVDQGETVTLETLDCFSNQIKTEEDQLTSVDFSKVNPATGPVYVNGAEPGDLLVVDILDIEVADQGVGINAPQVGPLHDKVDNRTKIIKIEDGMVLYNDMKFPVSPMIGVIGVAPKDEDIPCGFPGAHGGNLDNKKIAAGSKLYFPVHVPGALFQCGDLHAAMGDGEIIGAGLEIAGTVKVKLDVIKQFPSERPIMETEDKWYTIATADEYTDALNLVTADMQQLLMKAYDWDATDAGIYMSLQGDVEVCQSCKPSDLDIVLRFGVPKQPDKPLIK